ncbi:hypothetical protein EC23916_A0171 [Escherichia coli 2.3916]|nr:hypothetical protein EC23916_A0171 [Escherichia coli 2.3916]ESA75575.1 hypothetical protein HMPREF1589_00868 [Escherichia coli 113290]ESA98886.1 hypothetical protein HMPREF1620_00532 [Escherichia coli 909945-2]
MAIPTEISLLADRLCYADRRYQACHHQVSQQETHLSQNFTGCHR